MSYTRRNLGPSWRITQRNTTCRHPHSSHWHEQAELCHWQTAHVFVYFTLPKSAPSVPPRPPPHLFHSLVGLIVGTEWSFCLGSNESSPLSTSSPCALFEDFLSLLSPLNLKSLFSFSQKWDLLVCLDGWGRKPEIRLLPPFVGKFYLLDLISNVEVQY